MVILFAIHAFIFFSNLREFILILLINKIMLYLYNLFFLSTASVANL